MTTVRPMRIPGNWREGFVLDFHTLSSTYVGDNDYGHPIFETTRSELGELLFRLKYRNDSAVLSELVDAAASFVDSWDPGATLIVTVPPSRARAQHPVALVASGLQARLGIPLAADIVRRKRDVPELKNVFDYEERLQLLEDLHEVDTDRVRGQKVLLFDDLYRSGATMNAVTRDLYAEGQAADVFAFALTRTRSHR